MNPLLPRWDFDDTTEWLRPVDLFLAIELLKATALPAPGAGTSAVPAVLEIGVWKGAWLINVTQSRDDVRGMGIDPYPGSPTLRQLVMDRAANRGLGDRFTIMGTPGEVCRVQCSDGTVHRPFSLVHIDGLHAEKQVIEDLRYAAEHCASSGVIIVDDYLHPAYPGVSSAMYQFLAEGDYAMFLVTRNKAYLCPVEHHAERHQSTERLLDASGLGWERYKGERSGVRYLQQPDVMGFPVDLCLEGTNDERVLAGIDRPTRVKVREQTDRWVPPGVRDLLRPVRNRLRALTTKGGRAH